LKTRNKKNTTNGSKPGASITSHFYQNLSGPAPELIGGTLPPSPNPTAIRVLVPSRLYNAQPAHICHEYNHTVKTASCGRDELTTAHIWRSYS